MVVGAGFLEIAVLLGAAFDQAGFAAAASLRMWEPNGGQGGADRVSNVGLTALEELPVGYGCGGAKLTFTLPYLLEAFRPGCILKLYPNGTEVPTLPIEERLPKDFDPFLR